MKQKIRLQKIMIAVFATIISVILFGTYLGRTQTTTVVILNKADLDLNKKVGEQEKFFKVVEMNANDAEQFGGALASSIEQIKDKRLLHEVAVGTPITLSSLTDAELGGAFASKMPKYHTTFEIIDGINSLPPGTTAGDLIDIALTIEIKDANETKIVSAPLFSDIKIYSINETNVFVEVTQKQSLELSLSQEFGKFVLQLPGQKATQTCENKRQEIVSAVDEEISKMSKKEKKEVDRATLIENRLKTIECYTEDSKLTKVSKEEIINTLLGSDELSTVVISDEDEDEDEDTEDTDSETETPAAE